MTREHRAAGALVALACAAGCAGGSRLAAPSVLPAVVLHERHVQSGRDAADTLVIAIASGRVRVSHAGGDAILDLVHDRFVLLDPASATYRSSSLQEWEARIEAAIDPGSAGDTTGVRFEADGPGGRIAGYACERYHLFTHREIFPGEVEAIDQEIWVTRDLELPEGAQAAYERYVSSLDRMGLDARVQRPAGVTLRARTLTRPDGAGRDAGEFEESEILRVEHRPLDASWFDVPPSYRKAVHLPGAVR